MAGVMRLIFAKILLVAALLAGIFLTAVGFGGNWLILAAAIGYSWYDGFNQLEYSALLIIGVIFIVGEVLEFLSGIIGARRQKAAKRTIPAAMLGAFIGGIWGTGMLPLIGSVAGGVLGAYAAAAIAEYTKAGDWDRAQAVALGVAKGQFLGVLLKLLAAIGMAGVAVYYLFSS